MIAESMRNLVNNGATIRAMFEEGQKLAEIYGAQNVYDFSLGNPSVETPQEIKGLIKEILEEEKPNVIHGYMNNAGYDDVRGAIAAYINEKHHTAVSKDNILMTCGAAGGLNVILKTLLEKDDEVIVFAPFFGEYKNYIENYDGKIVIAETDKETFLPDVKQLAALITEKTKAVIINSPNNPTGAIYGEDTIKDLAQVLLNKEKELGKDIYLIADEPYREIVYDGTEVPYVINYYHNSFVAYSYSKSLSLPGERIGYIVVADNMNEREIVFSALAVANRVLGFVNAPSLFQKVIAKSLNLEVDVNIYQKNRDILYNHFKKIGLECQKPAGAFYLFPKSPIDDVEFCEIAKKYNILVVPGSVFGMKGYFRAAYCVSEETVTNSLAAFERLMDEINTRKQL